MKVAIVGSRGLQVTDLGRYLPSDTTQIISGGAPGVDACAREYAQAQGIPCVEILPDYRRYGKGAPLRRNREIVDAAELVVAFWDGRSAGTRHVIGLCRELGVPVEIHLLPAADASSGCVTPPG